MQSVLLPQRKQVKTFTAEMDHRLNHLPGIILTVSWSRQDSVTAEQNDELAEPEAEPRRATQVWDSRSSSI